MTFILNMILDTQPTTNLPLIIATVWIIQNDFAVYTTSPVTIGQYARNFTTRRYQNDLIDEILKRTWNPLIDMSFLVEGELVSNDMPEITETDSEEEFFKNHMNRQKSIWFLDSMAAFRKFEKDLRDPNRHIHRNGFFLVVYTGTERERLSNVKEIFRCLFNIYLTNINVMMMFGKYAYLYTYFPFAPNKCHSSQPEFYASFRGIEKNSNFTLGKTLFPSKVMNMFGCVMTIVTWTYAPYIYVDRDEITGEVLNLHGIEGLLMKLLSERMNFTIAIKEPEPKDRGEVYANGTATGATKMIMEGEANATILSYMYNKDRADYMLASESYLNLPYYLALPQGQPMTAFERLIKPFRYIIWSCFSSSFFFAIVLIYYLRFLGKSKLMNFVYGRSNRIPFTNLLATLFGGPVHNSNVPYRNFARFILIVWIWYTMVLRAAYSSELYILLQDGSPRNTIKSLQEVVDLNYTIYAFSAVEKVVKLTSPEVNTGLVDGHTNTVPKLFKRISEPKNKEKIALCLLELSLRSYNQLHPQRRVEILDEAVITSPVVFYMPRHSYLRFRTSELILRTLQAGIVKRYISYYLYSSLKSSSSREPTELSFRLLYGIFCVYACFLLLSVFILLLEICSKKSQWIRTFIDFLNF